MIVTVRWTGWLSYIFATLPEIKAVKQGHPTTVFCKMSVRRGKYSQEFFSTWGRLKIFRWPFHSCIIFEAYICGIFPTIFWGLILRISPPKLGYFSYKKGNLKFSDSKMWWREESKNSHFRNTLNCIWNFRENNTGFRKDLSSPSIFLWRHLKCISQLRSKITLDSLKSVLNVFRRSPSFGAPG